MRLLWPLALTIAAVIGIAIPFAQEAIAANYDCTAVARQGNGWTHSGGGKSLAEAEANALFSCRTLAKYANTCVIQTSHCNTAPTTGATDNQRWIVRQLFCVVEATLSLFLP